MPAISGTTVNWLLNGVGLHLVRTSTLERLTSPDDHAADVHEPAAEAAAPDDIALRLNERAHQFRAVAQDGEPVEQLPVSYLKNLQRESLALRDASAEIIRLKLELARAASPAATAASPTSTSELYTPVYDYLGLRTDPAVVHNHDFMRDPRFIAAYRRGTAAEGYEPHYFWRTHVALWCASVALKLGGDFVECGVCRGMLSSSIMSYLDWNAIDRRFFLFDTFTGLDETQVTDAEIGTGNLAYFREMYKEDIYDAAVKNFAESRTSRSFAAACPRRCRPPISATSPTCRST